MNEKIYKTIKRMMNSGVHGNEIKKAVDLCLCEPYKEMVTILKCFDEKIKYHPVISRSDCRDYENWVFCRSKDLNVSSMRDVNDNNRIIYCWEGDAFFNDQKLWDNFANNLTKKFKLKRVKVQRPKNSFFKVEHDFRCIRVRGHAGFEVINSQKYFFVWRNSDIAFTVKSKKQEKTCLLIAKTIDMIMSQQVYPELPSSFSEILEKEEQ